MKTIMLCGLLLAFGFSISAQNQVSDSSVITISDKDTYTEIISGDSIIRISHQSMYENYLTKGVALSEAGDYEKAIEYFNAALLFESNDAYVYYNRGLCFYYLKAYENAEKDFLNAVYINPLFAEACSQLGIIYSLQEKFNEAEKYMDKALEIMPDNGIYYYNKGLMLLMASKPTDACLFFDKAIEKGYKNAVEMKQKYCDE
jgi:tetratricopeptide (TPR) repeat protein